MTLSYNDDQRMLCDTASGFVAEATPVKALRQLRDSGDQTGYSPDLWKQFAEMGFTSILIPEAEGGMGMGHMEAGIVLHELGRNVALTPFLSTAIGAVTALKHANDELRGKWFEKIASADAVVAIAVDEASKHKPQNIALEAKAAGDEFVLNGDKTLVVHGHTADLILVAARTSGAIGSTEGLTLFAVEKGAEGLTASPERLVDSSFGSLLRFDNVKVNSSNVIGEVDKGWTVIEPTLLALSLGSAAELQGVATEAMDMTVEYLKVRKQFDVIIGTFQALQHRAAHLFSELEVSKAAIRKAQRMLDDGETGADKAIHVAKAMAENAGHLSVQEGVQLHGGIGMTDEHDIGLYMKRARALAELFGDANYHADQLAQKNGY